MRSRSSLDRPDRLARGTGCCARGIGTLGAIACLCLAAALTLAAAPAAAKGPAGATPAGPTAGAPEQIGPEITAFQAPRDLSRYKEEPVPGGTLLFVAYLVMWVLLGAFVARLLIKQSRLEAEVRALEDRVEPGGDTP